MAEVLKTALVGCTSTGSVLLCVYGDVRDMESLPSGGWAKVVGLISVCYAIL